MRDINMFIFGTIWLTTIFSLLFYLRKKDNKIINKINKYLLTYLVVFKILETAFKIIFIRDFASIPVDFSAIMYYLLPISFIFNKERILKFAVFGSFMAGILYLVTFIFIHSLYVTFNTYDLITSSINHGILFFSSVLIMYEFSLSKKDYTNNIIFTGILFLYSFIMWHIIDYSKESLFVYEILFGRVLGIKLIKNKILFHISNVLNIFIVSNILNIILYKVNMAVKREEVNLVN